MNTSCILSADTTNNNNTIQSCQSNYKLDGDNPKKAFGAN